MGAHNYDSFYFQSFIILPIVAGVLIEGNILVIDQVAIQFSKKCINFAE